MSTTIIAPEFTEVLDPATGHGVITVSVDGVMVAGAVAQKDWRDGGTMWQVLSTLPAAKGTKPATVRDEDDARAWLRFLAALYQGDGR